jgi:hypothetical protein
MNPWMKRLLLILEIGGGFVGLSVILLNVMEGQFAGGAFFVAAVFALVYCYGIGAGLVLAENLHLGILLSLIYQLIQIPIVRSADLFYLFSSGAMVSVFIGDGTASIQFSRGQPV